MEKFIDELREVWDSEENALRCGGTYSFMNLRKCLNLFKEIENHRGHPKYEKALDHLTRITEIWRKALKRHNSQELKFIEYDVDTGLPVDGESPSSVSVIPVSLTLQRHLAFFTTNCVLSFLISTIRIHLNRLKTGLRLKVSL